MAQTDVFTAYLKNSVTRLVDPFRVIAWRFACFVDAMIKGSRVDSANYRVARAGKSLKLLES